MMNKDGTHFIHEKDKKIIFLSDVHLGAFSDDFDRQLEQNIIELIDFAEENGYSIKILGDFFDYWMEYPGMVPELGKHVLRRFEYFHQNNPATLFITGNHDNWVDNHFSELGFDVEMNYRMLKLDEYRVLLHHGDGISDPTLNLPRPLMHRLLRNDKFVKLYQKLFPPAVGLHLMRKFAVFSRKFEKKDPRPLNQWSQTYLSNSKINVIICGHDHIPRVETFPGGMYINLGTFFDHKTVGIYNNGNFQLVEWNNQDKGVLKNQDFWSRLRPENF